ncbi:MAG: hypothetical protein IKL31_07425, partial [Ruminococcus sp.]|nr:hypothetical protein [Ruminococcus sp.]
MRKYIKNNILEIFETLHEAHEIIAKYIDNKKFDNACNLLADCQDTATQLFNTIEESEGEEFVTLSLINEYYEELFNIASNLSEKSNGCNVKNRLNNKIDKAEVSARNDIKVRLEIVFMPYKASMWDSLESVWKAADEDPDCDAYVVPIPYFDRKPDHSFGEFHYEGDQYPGYVPVVHYNSYNLKQRRPDAIYIHNPYDGNNFVTSVHPNFYSSELKKYTECLVYIPYFVVQSKNFENINHYVLAPGVINSDYAIVQSEKVRQKYIDVFLPHYGNTNEAKQYLENKILGLGSPKFDAVRCDKPTIESLPEEWQHIIGDGNKKIIFFNTHLSLLMAANYEQFLIKLKNVLDYFKSRKDIILLWRPHPLALATAKSMNPVALEPYLHIVKKYKAEKWGIYDDTPDMDRSIAFADAYYGSESSVVPVFSETGKSILIQNVRCNNIKKHDIFRISPSAFCVEGYDIWLFHSMMNLLVKYNMLSNTTEIIGQLDGEEKICGTLISDMFYANGQLIMIPC